MPWDSFNTQPPEGGWSKSSKSHKLLQGFNTQPPEGGWRGRCKSRSRKASFNTQPPEGGWSTYGALSLP